MSTPTALQQAKASEPQAKRVASPASERDLREAAVRYVLSGSAAFSDEELTAAQGEVTRRMTQAQSAGLTERDVVIALFHPIFSPQGHCRCPSCRQTCLICHSSSLQASADPL